MVAVLARFEKDLHRNALHDLHVIPGRILRREQAEYRSGGSRDTIDVPPQRLTGRVHVNFGALTDAQAPQLCFLKIGGDPHVVERHDR